MAEGGLEASNPAFQGNVSQGPHRRLCHRRNCGGHSEEAAGAGHTLSLALTLFLYNRVEDCNRQHHPEGEGRESDFLSGELKI